jgi:hypothetical protein
MEIYFNLNEVLSKIQKIFFLESKLVFHNKIIIQQQDAKLEKVLQ